MTVHPAELELPGGSKGSSRTLDPRLLVICICVFSVMLGTGIIGPILPLYAKAFGVSYAVVGMMISAFGLARILMDLPAGTLADCWGRRPLLLIGMAVFSTTGLIAAFAPNIYFLVLARFIQGIGAALLTTTAMAVVGDIAPPEQRGKYLSYYQMSFFWGMATGPAIGGFLAEWGGFPLPFLVLSLLSLVGMAFAHFKVKESLVERNDRISAMELFQVLRRMGRDRNLLVANLASLVAVLTMGGIRMTAIPLYGQQSMGLSHSEIGIVLAVAAFVNIPSLIWSGPIIDKIGSRPILLWGFSLATVTTYGLAFTHGFHSLLGMAALFGFTTGLNQPALATLVIGAADPNHRGLSIGLHRIFGDLGVIAGPMLVGVLADHYGLTSPFAVVAVLCGGMALVSLLVREEKRAGAAIRSDGPGSLEEPAP